MVDAPWRLLLTPILLTLSISLAAPAEKLAETVPERATGWSEPRLVVAGRWFHELSAVVDSTDHAHVVAVGQGGLWYLTDRGGTWTGRRILSHRSSMERWFSPSIALDARDRVHIATMLQGPHIADRGIWYVTDKGRARGSFSRPERIAPSGIGQPSLKMVGSSLALAAVKDWCCVGAGIVQFRTNVTGRWTHVDLGRGENPSLRIGDDRRPRVAWTGADWAPGVWYASAATRTGRFSTVRVRSGIVNDARLALDARDQPHIVWSVGIRRTSIEYAHRTGTGWQGPAVVPGRPWGLGFTLDGAGRPMVATGDTDIRVVTLMDDDWHQVMVADGEARSLVLRGGGRYGRALLAWADGAGVWVSRR